MSETPPVPTMEPWNLGLRFVLELAALVGLGALGWSAADGALGWVAAVIVPVIGVTAWGVFNVPDDPSRSGRAPIPVPGATRFAVEVAVLGLGAVGMLVAGWTTIAWVYLVVTLFHYIVAWRRLAWLLA